MDPSNRTQAVESEGEDSLALLRAGGWHAPCHRRSPGNYLLGGVVKALGEFDQLWTAFHPAAQTRIVQLLVERVTVGKGGIAAAGKVSDQFVSRMMQLEADETSKLFEDAFSIVALSTPRVGPPSRKDKT